MFGRPGRPRRPDPEALCQRIQAARAANNNALPPDLSLMAKAREGGPAYIYSLLTGFKGPPRAQVNPNMHYNAYFPGSHRDAAAAHCRPGHLRAGHPVNDREQMAHDVATFLSGRPSPIWSSGTASASR